MEELIRLWKPYVQDLKNFSKKENRSILFTEIGYRSIHRSTVKPWDYSVREQPYNGKAQVDALEAMFLSFQKKTGGLEGLFGSGFLIMLTLVVFRTQPFHHRIKLLKT